MRTLSILLALLTYSLSAHAYYGRDATEAVIQFEAVLDLPFTGTPNLAEWNGTGEVHNEVLKRVHDQILHLDGVFHSETFAKKWGGPASCGPWYEPGTYNVNFEELMPGAGAGRVRVKYRFESTIVVAKDPLARAESKKMDVWLPLAPDLIYDFGVARGKNQCTNREDNVRDSFYYYWDPFMNGCPLLKDHPESIQWLQAKVSRLANTRHTYPQYDTLYKDGQDKATLNIAMFWGYISHNVKAKKPFYRDDGFQAMKFVTENLLQAGFTETEYLPHFYFDGNGRLDETKGANVSRKLEKVVQRNGHDVTIQVTMLLADTAFDADDTTFHRYVKPALNDADIFIYDGHSGDGDNLSPEKLNLPAPLLGKYQIFFINGCDSYMNYMKKFVTARGGLQNLDLVISGTPTDALASAPNDWAFLEPFANLKTLSYQTMLDRLEKSNGGSGTFLVGVKGDEKNTWRPK